MSVTFENSHLFYQKVSQEVGRIISNLTHDTTNETLKKTNEDAREKLEAFRKVKILIAFGAMLSGSDLP